MLLRNPWSHVRLLANVERLIIHSRQGSGQGKHILSVKHMKRNENNLDPLFKSVDLSSVNFELLKQQITQFVQIKSDAHFLNLLLSSKQFVLARDYMKKKFDQKEVISSSEMFVYLRNAPKFREHADAEIIERFVDAITKTGMISDSIAIDLAFGLSVTRRWKEAFSLLNLHGFEASSGVLHELAVSAIGSWDYTTCFDIFEKVAKKNLPIQNNVLEMLMDSNVFESLNKTGQSNLRKFLTLLAEYDLYPSSSVMQKLEIRLQQNGYKTERMILKGSPTKFQCCKTEIKDLSPLSMKEHSRLKGAVMKKVLIGGDIFLQSIPEEINRFEKFMDVAPRFDIVIDGLNVLHNTAHPCSLRDKYQWLLAVVKYFSENNRNVLVVGRNHMRSASRDIIDQIEKISTVFLVQDESTDDPFIIYACLKSGPDCFVVTRDFLRDHVFSLTDPELKSFLLCWKKTRQVKEISERNGRVHAVSPASSSRAAQFTDSLRNIHIPYDDGRERPKFQTPVTWMCAKLRLE